MEKVPVKDLTLEEIRKKNVDFARTDIGMLLKISFWERNIWQAEIFWDMSKINLTLKIHYLLPQYQAWIMTIDLKICSQL